MIISQTYNEEGSPQMHIAITVGKHVCIMYLTQMVQYTNKIKK